jgi:hypothetical protein
MNAGPGVQGIGYLDDVLVAPVGGGLAASYHTFFLEARATYRPAFGGDLFGQTNMATWNAGLSVGGEI